MRKIKMKVIESIIIKVYDGMNEPLKEKRKYH
jgi:hypothetical protein